MMKDKQK